MTLTITVQRDPTGAGRLRARARAAGRRIRDLAVVVASPHKLAVSRLRDMPLFLAGTGCVDFAAFHWTHGIGWLVTGLSLVLIEHVAADE